MPYKDLSEGAIALISGGFAGVCGALSYLLKIEEGKPFGMWEFLLHTTISAVFGLIAYELLTYQQFPPQVAGALCGVAGWGGTRLIRIFEVLLQKRLGITKEDLKQ